jgi:hypothetical protein
LFLITVSLEVNKRRPQPRRTDRKGKLPETDFFINSEYIVPWNRVRSMWTVYFGTQEEFPKGVGVKKIRQALTECLRYVNNAGVNSDEITRWKEKFEQWINEAENLTQTDEELTQTDEEMTQTDEELGNNSLY